MGICVDGLAVFEINCKDSFHPQFHHQAIIIFSVFLTLAFYLLNI